MPRRKSCRTCPGEAASGGGLCGPPDVWLANGSKERAEAQPARPAALDDLAVHEPAIPWIGWRVQG